jgi:AbrB family looped-hinge helix DNA binding protein
MPLTTLTSKGQVTIPKPVRDRLGLKAGDSLDFHFVDDGTLVVSRQSESPLGRLPGILSHLAPERPVSLEAMKAAVREGAAASYRKAVQR